MIIEKYKEVLYELYDVKITREELIKIINQFIEKHNIFFYLWILNFMEWYSLMEPL